MRPKGPESGVVVRYRGGVEKKKDGEVKARVGWGPLRMVPHQKRKREVEEEEEEEDNEPDQALSFRPTVN